MKKIHTLLAAITLLTLWFVPTSCEDNDVEESMVLSGQWRGDWGMYYEIEHRGQIYTFNSYDTDIVFYPDYDYATHGYGYQVDWYDEGPYSKLSYRFNWSVDRGIIRLYYPGYPEYNTYIRDYSMNSSRFSGYFSNGTQPFYLYKIADYYDWSYYYGYGDYYYWEDNHWDWNCYAKTRTTSPETSDNAPKTEDRIVRIGNRFAER